LLAVFAAIGVLAATLYALRFVQRAFHGPNVHGWQLPDLSPREVLIMASLMALLVWLGLYPQPVLNTFAPAMASLQHGINYGHE
jgi:NADH-quinone oxidoreductase subunit M